MKILQIGLGYLGKVLHKHLLLESWVREITVISHIDMLALGAAEVDSIVATHDLVIYSGGPGRSNINSDELYVYEQVAKNFIDKFHKSKKVILSSAGVVYGEGAGHQPFTESSKIIASTHYAKYQIYIESLLDVKQDLIIRLSNPYGPFQLNKEGQGFVAAAWRAASENRLFSIYGDGQTIRDYIYDEDFSCAAASLFRMNGAGIYNVASGVSYSQQQIIELVEEIKKQKIKLSYLPAREGDIKVSRISINKLKNDFGFEPKFNIRSGIENFIHYGSN